MGEQAAILYHQLDFIFVRINLIQRGLVAGVLDPDVVTRLMASFRNGDQEAAGWLSSSTTLCSLISMGGDVSTPGPGGKFDFEPGSQVRIVYPTRSWEEHTNDANAPTRLWVCPGGT